MACQHIVYNVADRVATMTFNRPRRMNAWTAVMERDVRDAMIAAAEDDDGRVIVLTGLRLAMTDTAMPILDLIQTRP